MKLCFIILVAEKRNALCNEILVTYRKKANKLTTKDINLNVEYLC